VNADSQLNYSGVLHNQINTSGGIIKSGSGTLVLSASNSYTGVTSISEGMLVAANKSALGTGGHSVDTMTYIYDGATLALQGGITSNEHFHVWGAGVSGLGAVRNLSGSNSLTDSYCLRSNVTVGVDSGTLNVASFYEDGGSFGLTKTGTGTLALTGSSTYTGNTTVNAGTLRLGNGTRNSNLADTANVILAAGATLNLNYAGTDTVSRLSVNGVVKPAGVYSAANSSFITGAGTLTVLNGSDYDTWASSSGVVGGTAGDDDHDGLTNFAEYAFGLDPKSAASVQPITSQLNPVTGAFTYTRRKQALDGLTYTVWYTTDLKVTWTQDTGATQTATAIPGTDKESVSVTLSPGLLNAPRLFLRLRAQ
jgi:autotransporter-associated beta strand protein